MAGVVNDKITTLASQLQVHLVYF